MTGRMVWPLRQMLTSNSPDSTRAAHPRITAASVSTTVTRSSAYPNGRLPPGHPAGLSGLATLPLRLVLCLMPRSRPEHASDQSARRVTEVDLAGDSREFRTVLVG